MAITKPETKDSAARISRASPPPRVQYGGNTPPPTQGPLAFLSHWHTTVPTSLIRRDGGTTIISIPNFRHIIKKLIISKKVRDGEFLTKFGTQLKLIWIMSGSI